LSSLPRIFDESADSPSSLLAKWLLDRDLATDEQSGDVECEAQVQPETPVQWPRARRTSKESAAVALSLIAAGGMARRQRLRGRARRQGDSERETKGQGTVNEWW
jgi:hypothetical protein